MPLIDDGNAPNGPGHQLKTAWVTLNMKEAHELYEALSLWAEDATAGNPDPQWHTHINDKHGNELTIAIGQTGAT
jgi:hypothetical protein